MFFASKAAIAETLIFRCIYEGTTKPRQAGRHRDAQGLGLTGEVFTLVITSRYLAFPMPAITGVNAPGLVSSFAASTRFRLWMSAEAISGDERFARLRPPALTPRSADRKNKASCHSSVESRLAETALPRDLSNLPPVLCVSFSLRHQPSGHRSSRARRPPSGSRGDRCHTHDSPGARQRRDA